MLVADRRNQRWIAEIPNLPGVMASGAARDQAIAAVERPAVEVIADRTAYRELRGPRSTPRLSSWMNNCRRLHKSVSVKPSSA
jgi:predicted RNase H-like HicB family nuclease